MHLGYCSQSLYEIFYRDSLENIKQWITKLRNEDGHSHKMAVTLEGL
jgi:hypothetical protein